MEMGTNLSGENNHANKKRVIVERLMKGRETATKLRTLIHQPVEEHGLVSVEDLALQIFRSFSVTLSELMGSSTATAQIAAVDGGGSDCSGESKRKLVGVKDRRGCYKRRKSSDSWMTVTQTIEDGYAWRKYGQKKIMNSQYPRCYYRCTHKFDNGCKALKQVQILQENPISYQTTYLNHHTCTNYTTQRAPKFVLDSDSFQPNLISFRQNPNIDNTCLSKKESKDDYSQSEDESNDAKSSMNPWQEILEMEFLGYQLEWDPIMNSYREEEGSGFQSCGSTSLHGLDMEVNQLGDLDNFQYFDDSY